MQRGVGRRAATGVVVALLGIVGLWAGAMAEPAPRALAEPDLPEPPALGAEIVADPLTSATIFAAGACGGGKGSGGYVEDGFRLEVTGTCGQEGDPVAISVPGRGVRMADGDLSVAFKITSADGRRAALHLNTRISGRTWIGAFVQPLGKSAAIYQSVDGVNSTLVTTGDDLSAPVLALPLARDTEWNRMSLRVSGGDAWLMLNDWPVLHASDVPEGAGGVGVRLVRVGARTNDELAAVVLADLLVSPIAGGDPARAPTYKRP